MYVARTFFVTLGIEQNKNNSIMKTTSTISFFHKKLILTLYGINAVVNINGGLNPDGSIPVSEVNYDDDETDC